MQVIGPVLDVEFAGGTLPRIYNAIRVTGKVGDEDVDIVAKSNSTWARTACARSR